MVAAAFRDEYPEHDGPDVARCTTSACGRDRCSGRDRRSGSAAARRRRCGAPPRAATAGCRRARSAIGFPAQIADDPRAPPARCAATCRSRSARTATWLYVGKPSFDLGPNSRTRLAARSSPRRCASCTRSASHHCGVRFRSRSCDELVRSDRRLRPPRSMPHLDQRREPHAARRSHRPRLRHRARHRARDRARVRARGRRRRARGAHAPRCSTRWRAAVRARGRRALVRADRHHQARGLRAARRRGARGVRAHRRARQQRVPEQPGRARSSRPTSTTGGSIFDVNLFGSLRLTQLVVAAHEGAGARLDRLRQLDVDPHHRADDGRLRGVEGRADDRRAARSRRSSGPTASASTRSCPATSGARRWRPTSASLATERGVAYEAVHADVTSRTALHHIPDSAEIADAVLFFASDLSRAITGQALDVNGGHFFD